MYKAEDLDLAFCYIGVFSQIDDKPPFPLWQK